MHVLLVEDNAARAAIIELMLRDENFNCDTTDLGIDALEIAKLYDYNIIILDLLLPDIVGYGFCCGCARCGYAGRVSFVPDWASSTIRSRPSISAPMISLPSRSTGEN